MPDMSSVGNDYHFNQTFFTRNKFLSVFLLREKSEQKRNVEKIQWIKNERIKSGALSWNWESDLAFF
jgi:hypothetical protein